MKILNNFTNKQVNGVLLAVLFHLLIYQKLISNYISLMDYFDELLLLIAGFIIFYFRFKTKIDINNNLKVLLSLGILILIIGLLGNLVNHYQKSLFLILIGGCFYLKPILTLIISEKIDENFDYMTFLKSQQRIIKFQILIIFIFCILNLFFDINMTHDYRYGIRSYKFLFGTGGELVLYCIYFFFILFLFDKNKNIKWNVLLCIICFMTFRGVGMGTVFCFVCIYLLDFFKLKLSCKSFIALIPIFTLLGWNQIKIYFLSETMSARAYLLRYSFENVKRFFPIGSGFSTYGSALTLSNYSPLYYEYGFNKVWGLSKHDPMFLTDSFWPMLLGETGILGLIVYSFILIVMLYYVLNRTKNYRIGTLLSIFLFLIILFYSTSSNGVLVGNYSVYLFLLLGILPKNNMNLIERI